MIPPDPLHPAIVHFPIVLILLGTVMTLVVLASPRVALSRLAAAVLACAAVGAIAATWSGDEDEEKAERAGTAAEQVFEKHEEWGERSRNAAIISAMTAGAGALSLTRLPRFSRGAMALTAVVSLAASWSVIAAGHYGGKLVYHHGVGVRQVAPAEAESTAPHKASRHRDDD